MHRPHGRSYPVSSHVKRYVATGYSADHPLVLSEFGGIACSQETGTWGYSRCSTAEDLARAYTRLLDTVRGRRGLAGYWDSLSS